jgi:uncharacterized membrane protein YheB (UPF0754 family)
LNARTAKFLRGKSYELAAEWLKQMLPEDQRSTVTKASVKAFEKEQEKYVTANGKVIVSAYSSRWFYNKLKKAVKTRVRPDFTIRSVKELGDYE